MSCAPGAIMAFLSFTTEHHSARRYDTFKEMILSTGLIGDGIGLYFASSFMAVSSIFSRGLESAVSGDGG